MPRQLLQDWGFISEVDGTISITRKHVPLLRKKRVYATDYSRETLFRNMAAGRISLFKSYPRLTGPQFRQLGIIECVKQIDRRGKLNVAITRNGERVRLNVGRILKLWDDGREKLGITDLHFRDSPLERLLHIDRLSCFNILCNSIEDVRLQEMMTFVLSTKGQMTDSHSDDPDGSNYCISGKKVWLAWDTFEGIEYGLQDVERLDHYVEQAAFDLDTFLSLKSSRWFFVSDGNILFLPGHLTHKVITLEKYAGFGSFYVSLPNYLRTMSRWLVHKPLWSLATRANDHLSCRARSGARRCFSPWPGRYCWQLFRAGS